MIESYFAAPYVLDRMRSGPMAPYLGALATELQAQDYSCRSIRRQLHNADSFGWWLTGQNLTVAGITDDVVGCYIGGMHRSARAGYPKGYRPHYARGLPRLLDLLQQSGVLPPAVTSVPAGDSRLRDFDRYLDRVRGLTPATRTGYLCETRSFLKHVFGEVRKAVLHAQTHAGIVKEVGPGRQGQALHALRCAMRLPLGACWPGIAREQTCAQLPNLWPLRVAAP